MNNFEFARKINAATSLKKLSKTAEELFNKRNSVERFDKGGIIDWLDCAADIALEFPVGTLIQWDESDSDCSRLENRRYGVYGVVKSINSRSSGVLDTIVATTTDGSGREHDRYLFIVNNNVRHANVPHEVVKVLKASILSENKIREEGNKV